MILHFLTPQMSLGCDRLVYNVCAEKNLHHIIEMKGFHTSDFFFYTYSWSYSKVIFFSSILNLLYWVCRGSNVSIHFESTAFYLLNLNPMSVVVFHKHLAILCWTFCPFLLSEPVSFISHAQKWFWQIFYGTCQYFHSVTFKPFCYKFKSWDLYVAENSRYSQVSTFCLMSWSLASIYLENSSSSWWHLFSDMHQCLFQATPSLYDSSTLIFNSLNVVVRIKTILWFRFF